MLKNKNFNYVKIFAISAMLNDLGSDSIKPFWPIFVTNILGAPATILGILDGFGEAISYIIRWPAGWFSDKYKKRKFLIWLGYFLAGISRIGYSLSQSFHMLFPFKAMDRLGKLRDPPRDSLLASYIRKKDRGKAFGLLNAADNLGAMLAPLFGLIIFSILSYRGLMFVAAIPSLISALLILYFIKEKKNSIQKIKKNKIKFSNKFKKFIFSSSFFALSWISISFTILYSNKLGLDLFFIPFILFIYSLASVIGSYFFGKISDIIGRKKCLIFSYILHIIALFGFFIIYQFQSLFLYFIFLLFFTYGFAFGSITTLNSAFIIDLTRKERRAEASGIFSTFFGFSSFFSSSIAGVVWDFISPNFVFCIAGVFGLIGLILLISLVK